MIVKAIYSSLATTVDSRQGTGFPLAGHDIRVATSCFLGRAVESSSAYVGGIREHKGSFAFALCSPTMVLLVVNQSILTLSISTVLIRFFRSVRSRLSRVERPKFSVPNFLGLEGKRAPCVDIGSLRAITYSNRSSISGERQ
jgi:hypothetical protein